MSMSALKAKPRAPQTSASGILWRRSGASPAPAAPHPAQPSICHGVHSPWPRKRLETNAASAPTAMPARRPSAAPATTQITVTGWTPGTGAKRTRPAAAAPASVATTATSRAESGPDSNQAAPATMTAPAARSSDSAASAGATAVHTAAAKATPAATKTTVLDSGGLPRLRERDGAIGDRSRKRTVMRDHEGRALGSRGAQKRGELGLSIGVDSARRLVEDQDVRLRHQHRGERESLALAAREIARMPVLEPGEADGGERTPRPREIAVDAERDLLVGALLEEIAAGILREVGGAAEPHHATGRRTQQSGRELRERCLPGAVRPGQRHDLAASELELGARQHREPVSVRE